MDAIVLGAGASGLMCAREAALRGRRVLVLDLNDQPGRKLLVTGGGRCNFTNLLAGPDAYVSQNPRFCVSALARYTPEDFIRLVEARRIPYHEEKHGQLFCDRAAADIRDMLVDECREAGVDFALGRRVTSAEKDGDVFRIVAGKEKYEASRLVVATGGLPAPNTGSTGFGLELARKFGLAVVEPEPALVGLRWAEKYREVWAELAGVSLPDVVVSCRGHRCREAVMFTHTGLSGPAILDVSLDWRRGDPITVDLLPDTDPGEWFRTIRQEEGGTRPWQMLTRLLPRRFAARFAEYELPPEPLARLSDAGIADLVERIKGWRIVPAGTESMETAEVMRGGVDTDELSSKTMESRRVPGLFFTGEVVDVTGRLGGYNLNWAWASGAAAGRAV